MLLGFWGLGSTYSTLFQHVVLGAYWDMSVLGIQADWYWAHTGTCLCLAFKLTGIGREYWDMSVLGIQADWYWVHTGTCLCLAFKLTGIGRILGHVCAWHSS